MHTSVVLHAEGWKSVYLNETLVTGLAPTDVQTFLKQRLRWAEGNLKIVHDINPLTCRGLTLAQRVSYASSIFHWTLGLPKLVFYLAPPWMLFSGTFPIAPFDRTIVSIYLLNMAALIATYKLLSRGRGRILMDEFFNMLNAFTLLQALGRLVFDGRKMGAFVVTDKKGGGTAGVEVLPHYVLLGFSLVFYSWGGLSNLWVLIGSIFANYLFALAIDRREGRSRGVALGLAIAANILGFKYLLGYLGLGAIFGG